MVNEKIVALVAEVSEAWERVRENGYVDAELGIIDCSDPCDRNLAVLLDELAAHDAASNGVENG